MRLAAGDRLGPYEIVGALGAGGMGEVYRARDTRLGREVAIKVLPAERVADEGRRRRFVQEARAASALNHPNIVTIHEIESAEGVDFIVMELVPGQTLDGLIPKQGMRLGEALRVAIPIADALAAAHGRGIVHRDLKPANVIVTREGVVKVLDFGLAKLVADEGEDAGESLATASAPEALTGQGVVTGTAGYMSPEQATGGRVDARSDVFSFGAVLYEMVTGRRAFAGKSMSETLTAVVRGQPKAPRELVPEIPEALERLILRCLRKEPERRFQHMSDLKVELQELKEESDSAAAAPRVPARRRPGLWLVGGIAAVLALAAVALFLVRRPPAAQPAATLVPLTSTLGFKAWPTFSPDGDQIAFAWNGPKRENVDVYIQMIGSTEGRRLTTDPDIDTYPAWSPDGRQIAFVHFARGSEIGRIHVVSPLGGPSRMLSEEPVMDVLSWSPDGRWLVTGADPYANDVGSDVRAVRLIDASTGRVRSLTSPAGSTYHTHPALTRDGRFLVYFSCTGRYRCQIEAAELGADLVPRGPGRALTRRNLWPGVGLASSRDSRSVVYGAGPTWRLWRVGVAGDRAPEAIALAGFLSPGSPAIAASRDRLVFRQGSQNPADIYRFEPGRPAEAVVASSAIERFPALSPDGRRLAWESGGGEQGHEIWVAGSDGSNPTRLTHGPGLWQGSPRWSADGRTIAFDSYGEDGHWDVWTIDAQGGPPRRLTADAADHNLPSWSSDGRFVYFSSNHDGPESISRVPATGGPEEPVSRAGGGRSQEAPDGRTLYFQRASRGNSLLLAMPLPGGSARTIVECVPRFGFSVGVAGVYHVGCARDPEGASLFLLDPATGRDRLLGRLERPGEGLAVSADGRTILYAKAMSSGTDLVLIENFR